jgi:pSer/pThr/pTyr-binding forkhead associated (FHA) protein
MVARLMLTVQNGSLDGKEYTFTAPARCIIGRAKDCSLRLPGEWEFMMVSRHHCEIEIDDEQVRVIDLGSRNGTYVNGKVIGKNDYFGCELADGDELEVGYVVFRVELTAPEVCPRLHEKNAEAALGEHLALV